MSGEGVLVGLRRSSLDASRAGDLIRDRETGQLTFVLAADLTPVQARRTVRVLRRQYRRQLAERGAER